MVGTPGGGGISYAAWKRGKVQEAHEKGGYKKVDLVAEQMMFDALRAKVQQEREATAMASHPDARPPSSATSASFAGADRSTEIDRLIEGLNLNEMRQGTPISRGPSMENIDESRYSSRYRQKSWTPESMKEGMPSIQVCFTMAQGVLPSCCTASERLFAVLDDTSRFLSDLLLEQA